MIQPRMVQEITQVEQYIQSKPPQASQMRKQVPIMEYVDIRQ